MTELLADHIILKSNDNFIFKVPHPDFIDNGESIDEIENLFGELKRLEFDHQSEIILFRTKNNHLGVIGEEFISFHSMNSSRLGMKLVELEHPDAITLLNMKPAKGPGFCTIEFSPINREMIFLFLKGNDRNWDHNFKKTNKLVSLISNYLDCSKVNVIEKYNS